jgi:hypothetical protein
VFLKRHELIGWISVGEHERLAGLGAGGLAAFAPGRRPPRAPARPARSATVATARQARERSELRTEATRRIARGSLDDSARSLGDARLREARETVAARDRARPGRSSHAEAPRSAREVAGSGRDARKSQPDGSPARDRQARSPEWSDPVQPARQPSGRHRAAKELIARAERNEERGGERWSRRDLAAFAREDRRLLRESSDPVDHAHRIGMDRRSFEELRGLDRERAAERIEKARRRDAQRLEVDSGPDRHPLAERPRLALERLRQVGEGAAPERREHLRALRRERRSPDHLGPRRNLSRGA